MEENTNATPTNGTEGAAQPDQAASAPVQPANPYDNAQQPAGAAPQQPAQPYGQTPFSQPYEAQPQPSAYQPQPQYAQQPYDQQQYGQQQPYGYGQQQYAQPPYGQAPYGQAPMQPGAVPQTNLDGKATGALVCGILSIVFFWSVFLSLVLGIVAIVLGSQVIKAIGHNSKAKGGKICGIVGVVLSALIVVFTVVLIGVVVKDYGNGSLDDLEYELGTKTSYVATADRVLPVELEGVTIY